ncbi:MAG TPA: hypothetical protein VG055_32615 [Planctomycetaceae bacterium]|jgi:hypothetical protein|nr:hypothetical protein [Planctomycetaceae bacterium]
MARTPPKGTVEERSGKPETLAELFLYLSDPVKRRELEQFRKDYEAINGPTDLTRRYTSTWPKAEREWLFQNDTKRWFEGLPPFARAYLRGKMEMAARDGDLDDMPDKLLRLFVSGAMKGGRGRDR